MKDCGKEQPGLEQLSKILQDSWKSPVRSNQESWNAGAGSGYSRDRQARWDGREMRTATTKVRREVYEVFRKLCQDQGRTPYGVLKELLLTWIEREAGRLFESGDPAVCAAVEALEEAPPWTGWHSSGGGSCLFESGDPAVCAAVEALEEAPPWTGWHSSGGGS